MKDFFLYLQQLFQDNGLVLSLGLPDFEEQQKKIQEKLKEKVENENFSFNLKRQENYLKKLEQIKQNAKIHREEVMKLSEMKEEWKNKPISDKKYLFKVAEEEFKKKQQKS